MAEPLLSYDHVTVSYDGAPVLWDVSFSIARGEVVAVVGESGSGKSTLLAATMGLLGHGGHIAGGAIYCKGTDLATLSAVQMQRFRGAAAGMVFQDCLASLTPTRTVGDLFYEEVSAHGGKGRAACTRRAAELLARLDLPDPERILRSYPSELSGGIGQRVGIAMALILQPEVLLADEPTSALDAISQKRVIGELTRICREEGAALVLVTHNIMLARATADAVIVLRAGRIMEQGPADQVLEAPQAAYTRELLTAVPRLRGRTGRRQPLPGSLEQK